MAAVPDSLLVMLRAVLAYGALLTLTRMLGKRQVAQLTFFDYVVGITIGSMVSTAVVELENQFLSSMTGVLTWVLLTVLIAQGEVRSRWFRHLVDGRPVPVVRDGRILASHLRKERISVDELMMLLRQRQVFDVTQVQAALLETSGQVSVLLKKQHQPVTPQDLGLAAPGGGAGTGRGASAATGAGRPPDNASAKLVGADLLRFEAVMESLARQARDPDDRRFCTGLAEEAARVRRALRRYIQ